MVTSADLKLLTVKELTDIARLWGIAGWHDMRKDDLVRALVNRSRSKLALNSSLPPEKVVRMTKTNRSKSTAPGGADSAAKSGKSGTDGAKTSAKTTSDDKNSASKTGRASKSKRAATSSQDVRQLKQRLAHHKEIRTVESKPGQEDRFVLLVRDAFWLQAYWEIGTRTVERAKVALGHHWHAAKPILRLFRIISDGNANPRREVIRDIAIHGGVNNWYVDVSEPPSRFQIEIGYLYQSNRFYSLASSNIVLTPQHHLPNENAWQEVADDFERIYKLSGGTALHNEDIRAVFEEKLQRPMSAPLISRFPQRLTAGEKTRRNFDFQIDADIVLFGQTDPSVQISIRGEPIRLNPDGSFSVRLRLPEKRHVFPIDAAGSDGIETQRVILAVERNTKVLETLFAEYDEED